MLCPARAAPTRPPVVDRNMSKGILLNRIRLLGVAIVSMLALVAVPASASAAGLTGAGSTLVAPLMNNWINGFEIKEGIPVKYGAVGSGERIKAIRDSQADSGVIP